MTVVKQFIATRAMIEHKGRILVIRESNKYADGTRVGQYDLIGGRLAVGERFDAALLREVKEETGLDITVGDPIAVSEWRPVVRGEQWQIIAVIFRAHSDSDAVIMSEDHDHFKWIDPKNYKNEGIIDNYREAFEKYNQGKY